MTAFDVPISRSFTKRATHPPGKTPHFFGSNLRASLLRKRRRVFRSSVCQRELRAIVARRLAGDFLERAVELRERLEAHFKRDFTHPPVRIEQEMARLFDARARHVIDEVDPGHLLEFLAEIGRAHVHDLRHGGERQLIVGMIADVASRLRDGRRILLLALQSKDAAARGEMLGESIQQPDERRVLLLQSQQKDSPAITQARSFIRDHSDDDLSLAAVAHIVNMSATYFSEKFKEMTGINFVEYVARTRIEKARNLLLNPNRRVSEVAFAVGFQSLSQFNRTFRKVVGESPRDYRAKLATAGT